MSKPSLSSAELYRQRLLALLPQTDPTDTLNTLKDILDAHVTAGFTGPGSLGRVHPAAVYAPDSTSGDNSNASFSSARTRASEIVADWQPSTTNPFQNHELLYELAICLWALRPAPPLTKEGLTFPLVEPWHELVLAPHELVSWERAVCRLDIVIGGLGQHVGTGFVVGRYSDGYIVMTNSHVVAGAVGECNWLKDSAVSFACDFTRYNPLGNGTYYTLAPRFDIHPEHDLALVYLPHSSLQNSSSPSETSVSFEPTVLTLAATAPQIPGTQIAVIGHPSFDSRVDWLPQVSGFRMNFGIKRFSPGYLVEYTENYLWRLFNFSQWQTSVWQEELTPVRSVLHDATTLSGSSGSCVIDLASGKVIGLHFGGKPHTYMGGTSDSAANYLFSSNGCVPLWTLRNDSLLSSAGVLFY